MPLRANAIATTLMSSAVVFILASATFASAIAHVIPRYAGALTMFMVICMLAVRARISAHVVDV